MSARLFPSLLRIIFWGTVIQFLGCSKPLPPILSPGQAETKLHSIAKKEYNLNVVTRTVGKSLWIYLPMEEPFYDIKASPQGPQNSTQKSKLLSIKYIDAQFRDNNFYIDYDIAPEERYVQDLGYASTVTQEFYTKQRNVVTAIYRAYGDFEKVANEEGHLRRVAGDVDFKGFDVNNKHKELVHAYVPTEQAPDFFVLVLADVKKGIEARMFFYLGDLLRAYSDPTFYEEYSKRMVVENPTGSEQIIGDYDGHHLDYHEVSWGELLAKQIIYRVRFKYQRSDFKPSEDTLNELLPIIGETFKTYGFGSYGNIQMHNLGNDQTIAVEKTDPRLMAQ